MQETGDLGGSLRSALARREPRRKEGELQLLAVEHGINIECAFDLLVRKWLILSKVCQPFTPPYSLNALTTRSRSLSPSLSHTQILECKLENAKEIIFK